MQIIRVRLWDVWDKVWAQLETENVTNGVGMLDNGRPLYTICTCVAGDCVSEHTTLYGERSCKCAGLMSDGNILDPGEVLSSESMLANENHEGERVYWK